MIELVWHICFSWWIPDAPSPELTGTVATIRFARKPDESFSELVTPIVCAGLSQPDSKYKSVMAGTSQSTGPL
jgi:hypothetical protein